MVEYGAILDGSTEWRNATSNDVKTNVKYVIYIKHRTQK